MEHKTKTEKLEFEYMITYFSPSYDTVKEGTNSLLEALVDNWEIIRCDTTQNCFMYILRRKK